jgi:hypothetical protein
MDVRVLGERCVYACLAVGFLLLAAPHFSVLIFPGATMNVMVACSEAGPWIAQIAITNAAVGMAETVMAGNEDGSGSAPVDRRSTV